MTISVSEKWESRPTTIDETNSVELHYIAVGSDDDIAIGTAVLAAAPTTYANLPRKGLTYERIAEDAWEAVVKYESPAAPDDQTAYSFDTTGGTSHITQALASVNSYAPAGQTAPDFKGAIGVTKDAVEGADIIVPVYKWTETQQFDPADVDDAFKSTLFALTGRTNSATFRNFDAGEVLFEGARGSQRGARGKFEISYQFSASPNVTGLTVGSITGIAKGGWEYLWVRYVDESDDTAHMLVKRPRSVHVERVYDSGDFSGLGIGT
jgi:hypothetical protein